jgi:hypothetical protein
MEYLIELRQMDTGNNDLFIYSHKFDTFDLGNRRG